MGSLQVHFWNFATEFWPLIDVRISAQYIQNLLDGFDRTFICIDNDNI